MYAKLTYLYILCCTVCLAASCTSDTPGDVEFGKGTELSFDTAPLSRASVVTALDNFAVYGDMRLGGSSSRSFVVFNGVPVTYDNSKWTYANTQYWFPKYEYSFVAVHPTDLAGMSDAAYSDNSLSFNYTLPEDFGDTPDLLVATHRRMYEEGVTPTVMLRFIHAMSRINFLVKCDGAADIVKVTKIELEGINKTGTFTVTPAPLLSGSKQTDDYELFWTDFQNNGTFAADIEVDVADGSEQSLFPDSNALFVIPQPDNDGIIMQITYTLIHKNGKTEERTLAAATRIGGWQHGKLYTYSLTLSSETKVIEMNVSVNDWKEGPVDNVQVPRK